MSNFAQKWVALDANVSSVAVVASGMVAIVMAVSRFFPSGGTFPAHDSIFFYGAGIQAGLALIIFTMNAGCVLLRQRWLIVPYRMTVPATLVVVLAWPHLGMVSEFVYLSIASWVLVAIIALDLSTNPVAQQRSVSTEASGHTPARVDQPYAEDDQTPQVTYPAQYTNKNFDDIVGMDKVKGELLEAAREVTAGKSLAGQLRNGILLYGEPGNGKTFFVEALSGQLGLPLLTATFGHVVSRFTGQTPEEVAKVFEDARAQAPCVLFIDEIDSLIRDRNQTINATAEEPKITNIILTELVRTRAHKVVIVAATNFLNKLDPAAIREGRFDFKIEITPPDEIAREALLRSSLAAFPSVFVDEDAIHLAAKRWEGFSVARIRAVGNEIGRTAHKERYDLVSYPDFQQALRKIQGRAGHLPADTPGLSGLTLPNELARQLTGIANRMQSIEKIEAMGAKVPTGLLFMGPPGTGKTLTARALAKSAQWAFISTSGNELLGNPDRIDEIVREAKDIRPTIIFIDEADDVLADRQFSRHTASVTNRLLTAMDGAGGKASDIVWIAATNHPDQLDSAALRGGRFTVKVEFQLPDFGTVKSHVKKWIAQSSASFSEDATPTAMAQELVGLSIANINAVLQQAVDLAVDRFMMAPELRREGDENQCVTLNDLREAIIAISG